MVDYHFLNSHTTNGNLISKILKYKNLTQFIKSIY